MRRARFFSLAGLALAVVGAGWREVERSLPADADLVTPAQLTGALAFVVVPALVAEWRRPGNPTSWLAVVVAASTAVAGYRLLLPTWMSTAGVLAWLGLPLIGCHLTRSIPDGLDVSNGRRAVVAAWITPFVLALAMLVAIDREGRRPASWAAVDAAGDWILQPNPLHVADADDLVLAVWFVWAVWSVVVATSTMVATRRRDRRASRVLRAASLLHAGSIVIGLVGSWPAVVAAGAEPPFFAASYAGLVLAAPALGLAALGAALAWSELIEPRLSHAVDGTLELGPDPSVSSLTSRSQRTLGDPTARVVYPSDAGGWIDDLGRSTTLADTPRRAATVVTREGRVVAALEHDDWLVAQPDLVDVAVVGAAFDLETARLAALARASTEDTQASGSRLLAAGERARSAVERLILDGPDRTLAGVETLLAVEPLDLQRVHDELLVAVSQIRAIAHEMAPPTASGAGIEGVLEGVVSAAPCRVDLDIRPSAINVALPASVASTVHLVAREAFAGGAREVAVVVDVEREPTGGVVRVVISGCEIGTGSALLDRVETLGGTLTDCGSERKLVLPVGGV